jgi:transcriptional regulator with XRE-family HTH domain
MRLDTCNETFYVDGMDIQNYDLGMIKDVVAERVGVTHRSIDNYLSDKKTPRREIAKKLEAVTGIAKEVWVFGTERERRILFNWFMARILDGEEIPYVEEDEGATT